MPEHSPASKQPREKKICQSLSQFKIWLLSLILFSRTHHLLTSSIIVKSMKRNYTLTYRGELFCGRNKLATLNHDNPKAMHFLKPGSFRISRICSWSEPSGCFELHEAQCDRHRSWYLAHSPPQALAALAYRPGPLPIVP